MPVLPLLLALLSSAAAYDALCAARGPCDILESSYISVIEGASCASFYATGQCSGLCTRTLRATLHRSAWRKCASRCDWPPALVAAADSWLGLCLARPAPGADEAEVVDIVVRRGAAPPAGAAAGEAVVGGDAVGRAAVEIGVVPQVERQGRGGVGAGRRRWVVVAGRVLFVVVALVVVGASAVKGRGRGSLASIGRRMRGVRADVEARPSAGVGILGASASLPGRVSRDVSHFHRGARRHLKAYRANVD